jgi:Rrf2 family protein
MKLTRASSYTLHALVRLATAPGAPLLTAHALAGKDGTSERFLHKLLAQLVHVGLLHSLTGPGGGFRLARPATQITLLEIVEAVAGPLRGLVPLLETKASAKLNGQLATICDQAAETVRKQLAKVRLSDLAG